MSTKAGKEYASLMRNGRWLLSTLMALASCGASAQTVFLDTFGSSSVRTTSPYVPQAYLKASDQSATTAKFTSGQQYYTFAYLSSTADDYFNRNNIDNGYYAVGNPAILSTGASFAGQS